MKFNKKPIKLNFILILDYPIDLLKSLESLLVYRAIVGYLSHVSQSKHIGFIDNSKNVREK